MSFEMETGMAVVVVVYWLQRVEFVAAAVVAVVGLEVVLKLFVVVNRSSAVIVVVALRLLVGLHLVFEFFGYLVRALVIPVVVVSCLVTFVVVDLVVVLR